MAGILRQSEQYGLEVPREVTPVPEHLVAENLRQGNKVHPLGNVSRETAEPDYSDFMWR